MRGRPGQVRSPSPPASRPWSRTWPGSTRPPRRARAHTSSPSSGGRSRCGGWSCRSRWSQGCKTGTSTPLPFFNFLTQVLTPVLLTDTWQEPATRPEAVPVSLRPQCVYQRGTKRGMLRQMRRQDPMSNAQSSLVASDMLTICKCNSATRLASAFTTDQSERRIGPQKNLTTAAQLALRENKQT